MADEPAWVCDGCGERYPQREHPAGEALDEARHHVGTCADGDEAVFDDGFDADDYDVDFEEGSA